MDETGVIAAIFAKLKADTTLRGATYLGSSAPGYGIYRHNFLPDNPSFPRVTLEFIGGPTDRPSSWEDNICVVTVRVYHGNPPKILARIEQLLNQRTQVITATDAEIRQFRKTAKGADLWDDEFQVHYRLDNYTLRYRLFGGINT